MCYYFHDIIKIEGFDFDKILIDEKSCENVWVFSMSYKILIGAKALQIRFDNVDRFIRVYVRTRYLVLFGSKNMVPFTIGLDILFVEK